MGAGAEHTHVRPLERERHTAVKYSLANQAYEEWKDRRNVDSPLGILVNISDLPLLSTG